MFGVGYFHKINKNNSQNLIYLSTPVQIRIMYNDLLFTPKNKPDPGRTQRIKRFTRKPVQKSQRSSSKKSLDSSVKQMYIKSPTSMARDKGKDVDFFATLASSLITSTTQTIKKQENTIKYKPRYTERSQNIYLEENQNFYHYDEDKTNARANNRIHALEAQIQLKNHQIIILSGQIQRLKGFIDQDKEKRRKLEGQKRQLTKQLKQITKTVQNVKIETKKLQKQKQHLLKQIQFLQRINYDEKTRSLQSYRQRYLQGQVQRLKKQLHKSRGQRQQQLQHHLKNIKQQKFTIQAHYKAMKVANECLIKQINHTQQNIHDIILNSDQYTKLRDKYVHFLQEYKLLRNQYWSFKAEMGKQQIYNDSSLFSITAQQIQGDLSMLKNSPSNPNLANLINLHPLTAIQKTAKTKSSHEQENQPTYSNKRSI